MNEYTEQPSIVVNCPERIRSNLKFPVVGIGASAGGLAALLRMFENMPDTMDMAFVIVLHLSPEHDSIADQMIQNVTRMPVVQVKKKTIIEKNHIYIIAPKKQLSMNDGWLEVTELRHERGERTAIDNFFRSLAEVHGDRALAIVLSGMGTDGSVGLTRIKEQGGVTLAQTVDDAEHDDMPLAAVATGAVDFILPVIEIPQKPIDIWSNASQIKLPPLEHAADATAQDPLPESIEEAALVRIIALLGSHTGHNFKHYKRATVLRRIERRMQVCAVPTLSDYVKLLEQDQQEITALFTDMLIGVTNFFRDRVAFDTLEREIIPEFFKERGPGDEVRVWTTACSTGEEAYSIAILLAEQSALLAEPPAFRVFASDINDNAIKVARTGRYPSAIVADVSPSRLREFFTKEGDYYQIRESIRGRVLFASHNLLRDPPFAKLDLITCRNLLIYLNRDVQTRLLKLFHFVLKPEGMIFLGSSESADTVDEYFISIDKKSRIYRARAMLRLAPDAPSFGSFNVSCTPLPIIERRSAKRRFSYADVHLRALAEQASPSIIVDRELDLLHTSKHAGRFMRFDGGEPTTNIISLILPELRADLRTTLYQAQQYGSSRSKNEILLRLDGQLVAINLSAKMFEDKEAEDTFILVIFEESESKKDETSIPTNTVEDDFVIKQLESELQRTKKQLQETIEHAEISTEELRAANEELQAINEELRSTTEELEANREELHSVNEALITVNQELKMKVEEANKTNDDLNNLIASTDIATIFVDRELRIKRFTPRALDVFNLIDMDIGRSLFDITHRLDYGELAFDVTATLENLSPIEREVLRNDGLQYIVRLRPYRTVEDKIGGVVMTFFDAGANLKAEMQKA